MIKFVNISTIFILLLFWAVTCNAQISIDQRVVCTSNFEGTTNGIHFMSSIGQPFYTTLSGSAAGFTQGFQQPGYLNCPGDFDNNGIINITDLLIFNTVFSTNNLNADMNGDGFIGVTDLIMFITLIGTGCSN